MDLVKEESIIFQKAILQCACLVTGAKNTRVQINTQIDLWNSRASDELLNCSYATAAVYFEICHRTQNAEQRNPTFSNIVLR